MPRRVLYDATSRAAVAAADLLRDAFDVAPLSTPTPPGPAVALMGDDAVDTPRDASLRVLALVDPHAPVPARGHVPSLP